MDWDAIGAMGEIIGALAVIVTVYFLSRQLKINALELEKSNDISQAQSTLGINSLYVQIWQPIMQDAELAAIYLKAINDESLTPVEELRFCSYVNTFLALIESLINQNAAGVGFDELKDDVRDTFELVNPYLGKILDNTSARKWLFEEAPGLFTEEFLGALREHGPLTGGKGSALR